MASPQEQFRRTYELIIGDPSSGDGLKITGDEARNEGLDIRFDIKKFVDNKGSDNTSDIYITNLAEKTINFIKRENAKIILKVGYDGDNKVIYVGDVSEIESNQKAGQVDRETKITCIPDANVHYSPTISKTFPANTKVRAILDHLIGQGTISKGSYNSGNIEKTFPFGYTVDGTPKEILNDLSRDFNFNYRIDNRRLYVSDPNEYEKSSSKENAYVISPDTGLIGTPVYASADGKKIKNAKTKKEGVKFSALLNPLIQPGQAVKLKSSTVNGVFRVNAVEFKGSWRGNDWMVTCWCAIV